ncbi:MAG TPA: hypothetical protein VMZ71_07645 [Gemmataceae bacterium]|nr:hypothetical protein [Gemmataceae bacterium]
MRRAGRILLNVATVLSAVLAVGAAVLWVQSYWVDAFARYAAGDAPPGGGSTGWAIAAATSTGGLDVYYHPAPSGVAAGFTYSTDDTASPDYASPFGTHHRFAGLRFTLNPRSPGEWSAYVPFGYVVALFAATPLVRGYRRYRRGSRRRPGHCAKCGYDLRATPSRCPECGAMAKAANA